MPPVVLRPHLDPVHDEPVAAAPPQGARGEEGEIRKRRDVDDVVLGAVPPEVACDRRAEPDGRQERAALVAVHAPRGRDADDPHVCGVGRAVREPMPHRHVGHVVARPCEVEPEVAHPSLGAAYRLREEVVVDQADAEPGAAPVRRRRVTPIRSLHNAGRELILRFNPTGIRSWRSPSWSPASLASS